MQLENQPEVAKVANHGDSNIAVAAQDAHTLEGNKIFNEAKGAGSLTEYVNKIFGKLHIDGVEPRDTGAAKPESKATANNSQDGQAPAKQEAGAGEGHFWHNAADVAKTMAVGGGEEAVKGLKDLFQVAEKGAVATVHGVEHGAEWAVHNPGKTAAIVGVGAAAVAAEVLSGGAATAVIAPALEAAWAGASAFLGSAAVGTGIEAAGIAAATVTTGSAALKVSNGGELEVLMHQQGKTPEQIEIARAKLKADTGEAVLTDAMLGGGYAVKGLKAIISGAKAAEGAEGAASATASVEDAGKATQTAAEHSAETHIPEAREPAPTQAPEIAQSPEPAPTQTPETAKSPEAAPAQVPEIPKSPEAAPAQAPEIAQSPEPAPAQAPDIAPSPEPAPAQTPEIAKNPEAAPAQAPEVGQNPEPAPTQAPETTQNFEPPPATSHEVASAKPGALVAVKQLVTGAKKVNQAIEPLKTGKEAANTGNDLYNSTLHAYDNVVSATNPMDLSAAAPKAVDQI